MKLGSESFYLYVYFLSLQFFMQCIVYRHFFDYLYIVLMKDI